MITLHWHKQVKEQLDRDVELGIIKPVDANEPVEWQHRMVVVRKHNGTPRRTVDMQALNRATLRHTHPLTSPYQKAMSVPSNVYKTVTDAWEGYHAVPITEESLKLTRFITPFGAYRYLRSPQGFHSSGDGYNRRFDSIIAGVTNTIHQVDDSLLWETTVEKNFHKTCSFLTLMGRNGMLQNPDKFQFCKMEVNWSGFVIGKDSVRPMPHLTNAIRDFPMPVNRTDLRSFMALAQQVSYSTAVAPLLLPFRTLLKDGTPWEWTDSMSQTFLATREILADRVDEGIKMFDPYKVTLLTSDWCRHDVGFILVQKHCRCVIVDNKPNVNCCKDGWRVCMVGSRFTLPAEGNYAATKGELLGITYALEKTKYFTLGCPHLYVGTDHKPLLGILNDATLDSMDNPRIIRLKEKTMGWKFPVIYIPGKEIGGTDALSRYGVRHDDCEPSVRKHLVGLMINSVTEECEDDLEEMICLVRDARHPLSWMEVKQESSADSTCQGLIAWISQGANGSVESKIEDDSLKQFQRYRADLSVQDGVILYKGRLLIPNKLRQRVLDTLHSSHQGTTGMLLRAERSVFWPGMSLDIKKTREKCKSCDVFAPSQANMPPIAPESPVYPFQHICSDYFMLHGIAFLVIVDRFSGWFNIHHGKGGTLELVRIFARLFQDMGVPESLTSDGGPTYISEQFLSDYGVDHRLSSVGFPHGNTRSEIAVKSAKRLLRSNVHDRGNLDTVAITRAMLEYRKTPDRDIGLSPAEMLYGRRLKDFLPSKPDQLIQPLYDNLRREWKDVAEWREKALAKRGTKIMDKLTEHTKELPELSVSDHVLIQNQLGNNPRRWEKRGIIVEVLPYRQYKVRVDGSRRITLRNRKFLRQYKPLQMRDGPLRPAAGGSTVASGSDAVGAKEYQSLPVLPSRDAQTQPIGDAEILEEVPRLIPECSDPQPSNQCLPDIRSPLRTQQAEVTMPFTPSQVENPDSMTTNNQSPQLRRSSRPTRGITSKYEDHYTGVDYDGHMNSSIVQCGTPVIVGEIVGTDCSLMAMQLPTGFEDKSTFWTPEGWVWIQH